MSGSALGKDYEWESERVFRVGEAQQGVQRQAKTQKGFGIRAGGIHRHLARPTCPCHGMNRLDSGRVLLNFLLETTRP